MMFFTFTIQVPIPHSGFFLSPESTNFSVAAELTVELVLSFILFTEASESTEFPGRYAFGTDSNGPMGTKGKALLKEMERLNIILDATHLCDESFREAMDTFNGHVWASHHNCRALVNHNRQFSDDQLKELISRGAVIGAPMDAWMIVPGWVRGKSTPQQMGVTLERVMDHIDHICQLAGNANHVGIGSDLDGGYGKEQGPTDVDTIADLQKLGDIFSKRGYSATDVENLMGGNWLRFLRRAWK